MSEYGKVAGTRSTPQTEPIPGSSQVANSAGGFTWAVSKWDRLMRFLVLGAEGGTYYIGQRQLIKENAQAVMDCAAEDAERTVNILIDVAETGRAPKAIPTIFALAMLCGHKDMRTRQLALAAVPRVCRIGTHLFNFLADIEKFRGWGRSLRRAVGSWYLTKDPRALAYQITKYQQRDGETHRDALRRSHPAAKDDSVNEVLRYAVGKLDVPGEWLGSDFPHRTLLAAVESAKRVETEPEILHLIERHNLVRECIPTKWLNSKKVWGALLERMPMTAMIRNLGKMTSIGLLSPMSDTAKKVVSVLESQEALHKSHIHPFNVLLALTTYNMGHGVRGKLTWSPVPQVSDALDGAFMASFPNVVPTNKNWYLGIDISGSMHSAIANTHISQSMAAAAMAMVAARTEPWFCAYGFSSRSGGWGARDVGMVDMGITKQKQLSTIMSGTPRWTGGSTDCSLPFQHALENNLPVDVFAVYTDNETYAGTPHPAQALQEYREKTGRPAKLIVVGMAANEFSIADPNDAGMLDVVGFDASAPTVMADFARD